MELVKYIYQLVLVAIVVVLVLHRLTRAVISWSTMPISAFGNRSIRLMLLSWFVYARVPVRFLGIDQLSPLRLTLSALFFAGTVVCNLIHVETFSQASRRAAEISLVLLVLLFLSGSREFPARLLGVSLETYGFIHRIIGLMSVIQATVHVALISRNIRFDISNPIHLNGLLGGCMLLSLLFLPMIKRRIYEAFLLQHHICAIIGLIAIWKHIQRTPKQSQWWLISCVAAFSSTGIFQGVRIIYRNFVFGGKHKSVRMSVRRCTENIVHATLDLPRPWTVRAGERVNLGVPSLGVFYFFQTHPFTITWWEENQDGSAFSITLMFRARNGFTRKLYTDPKQDYWAWIDGPFGPSLVQEYGLSRDLGDYGHILMVTTGVGIAAQLPYIKELLHRRDRAEIRTQKISLVWQIDCTGDWKSTREWLQLLVRQDKGCMLEVIVYDPLKTSSVEQSHTFGEHELITMIEGEANWEERFQLELEKQRGRLLVTVSARSHIRRQFQRLVRENVRHDVELFELEFQPWRERRDWWSFFTP